MASLDEIEFWDFGEEDDGTILYSTDKLEAAATL
jgi:hypothetical protein